MKRLLLIITLLLALTLVGCSNNDSEIKQLEQRIDILEERLADTNKAMTDFYVITENGKLYSNCRLEGMVKVCDEISIVADEENQTDLQCDLLQLVKDVLKSQQEGFTYTYDDNYLFEKDPYDNGNDIFDNEDLINSYCEVVE